MDDIYHCCRWCKWFQSDKCTNSEFTIDSLNINSFYEEGYLSEAIKEGFNEKKLHELESALSESKISKKKQSEILKVFHEELEAIKVDWVEEIDNQVSKAINNFDFTVEDGVEITNPTEFYCKNFW